MGTQQFCLKWNNHQANMVTIFEQLLSTEALVDVTIACDGLSLKAHKMVLSACSPYFQSLFLENPCKHPIVIMKDMKYTELKAIIDFMYRGEVNVSHDQLNALLKTAETLKVKGLAEVCGERTSTGGAVQQEVPQNTPSTPVHTNSTSTPILASTHIPTRTDSPTLLSKRKRGRPRKRSLSDSNRSDDEQVPPAKIKEPGSPDIEEISPDTSLDTNISENISSNSQTHTPVTQFSKSSIVQSHQSSSKSIQPAAMECEVEEPPSEDCDFELEPSKLMEQTLSTDVPKSAAAQNVSSVQISSSSSNVNVNTALVPASDFHSGQMGDDPESPQDIKPVLLTFEEPPVAGTSQDSNSMMYMESSGVPAIPGTSFQDSEGQIVQHDSQQQGMKIMLYGKRPRGRPRKIPVPQNKQSMITSYEKMETMIALPGKRPRGRPPKVPVSQNKESMIASYEKIDTMIVSHRKIETVITSPGKRPRGRPPKIPVSQNGETAIALAPKRPRGRPRKIPLPEMSRNLSSNPEIKTSEQKSEKRQYYAWNSCVCCNPSAPMIKGWHMR